MAYTVKSVNGVTIRLPDERWVHITEEHAEMAGFLVDVLETVQEPLAVFEGKEGELLAARETETGKYMMSTTGFTNNREMKSCFYFSNTSMVTLARDSVRAFSWRFPSRS